jgi:hypothetical protein
VGRLLGLREVAGDGGDVPHDIAAASGHSGHEFPVEADRGKKVEDLELATLEWVALARGSLRSNPAALTSASR